MPRRFQYKEAAYDFIPHPCEVAARTIWGGKLLLIFEGGVVDSSEVDVMGALSWLTFEGDNKHLF